MRPRCLKGGLCLNGLSELAAKLEPRHSLIQVIELRPIPTALGRGQSLPESQIPGVDEQLNVLGQQPITLGRSFGYENVIELLDEEIGDTQPVLR
jgi:hypothetical protein